MNDGQAFRCSYSCSSHLWSFSDPQLIYLLDYFGGDAVMWDQLRSTAAQASEQQQPVSTSWPWRRLGMHDVDS